ncbi:hypothetical protein Agub_g6000, partial [Astrephomene gubernaculifera]
LGLGVAGWQLRTWSAAQLALLGADQPLPRGGSPAAAAGGAAGSSDAAAAGPAAAVGSTTAEASTSSTFSSAGPFSSLVPEPLRTAGVFEEDWKHTDKSWLLVILLARLGTLLTAAHCLLTANPATATAAATFAAVCFAASLLPAAIPHVRQLLAASSSYGNGGAAAAAKLAVPLLAADVAFLVALAPAAPPIARAVAAAAMAAGLAAAAIAAAASPRLSGLRAAAGDVATFHVVLRLPASGTLIDTTWGHRPLSGVVGGMLQEEGGKEAAATATAAAAEQDQPAGVGAAIASGGKPMHAGGEGDPQARFRPLEALLSAVVLEGLYLGERCSLTLSPDDFLSLAAAASSSASVTSSASASPSASSSPPEEEAVTAGDGDLPLSPTSVELFHNPGLVWWQSLDDLHRKMGLGAVGTAGSRRDEDEEEAEEEEEGGDGSTSSSTSPSTSSKITSSSSGSKRSPVRQGDVFWYPLGGLVSELGCRRLSTHEGAGGQQQAGRRIAGADSWGPVRVAAVSPCGQWVQLDGNVGMEMSGEAVEVEVEIVELRKGAGRPR